MSMVTIVGPRYMITACVYLCTSPRTYTIHLMAWRKLSEDRKGNGKSNPQSLSFIFRLLIDSSMLHRISASINVFCYFFIQINFPSCLVVNLPCNHGCSLFGGRLLVVKLFLPCALPWIHDQGRLNIYPFILLRLHLI